MSNFDCMDDCIHLKACRRLQKITTLIICIVWEGTSIRQCAKITGTQQIGT